MSSQLEELSPPRAGGQGPSQEPWAGLPGASISRAPWDNSSVNTGAPAGVAGPGAGGRGTGRAGRGPHATCPAAWFPQPASGQGHPERQAQPGVAGRGLTPSVPAAWTPMRAATRRSWPSPSACAGAASAPGRAERRPRSTPCRCSRRCWCSDASPARAMPRGCPRPGPSPSTRSSSACPWAAPASCPGRHSDRRPWLSWWHRGGHGSPPQTGQLGSLRRGSLLFMSIYWLFICLLGFPGEVPRLRALGVRTGTEEPRPWACGVTLRRSGPSRDSVYPSCKNS